MVEAEESFPNWEEEEEEKRILQVGKERELEYTSDGSLEVEIACPLLVVGGVGWEGFAHY